MTRIIQAKAKFARKYDTDFWCLFLRKKGALNKTIRFYLSVGKSVRLIGSELFRNITYKLLVVRKKRKTPMDKHKRIRVRLRYFLGNINNRSLKLFARLGWDSQPKYWRSIQLFEGRVDFLLYRLNLITRLSHAKFFIKYLVMTINGVRVQNRAERLNLWFDEFEVGGNMRTKLFCLRLIMLRMCHNSEKFVHQLPSYLEINFTLFCLRFFQVPTYNYLIYPYSIKFEAIVAYSKHNSK